MKTFCKILLPGMLALVVSGTALAHEPRHQDGYRNDGWYGSATLWSDSSGHSGYAGTLSYGAGYGYAPGYIPWTGHTHGPVFHHRPAYGYAHGYKRGHGKGHKHGRKHRHRHH